MFTAYGLIIIYFQTKMYIWANIYRTSDMNKLKTNQIRIVLRKIKSHNQTKCKECSRSCTYRIEICSSLYVQISPFDTLQLDPFDVWQQQQSFLGAHIILVHVSSHEIQNTGIR